MFNKQFYQNYNQKNSNFYFFEMFNKQFFIIKFYLNNLNKRNRNIKTIEIRKYFKIRRSI